MTFMLPILIFDLDDTLYPEITYVESGFQAVAENLQAKSGWPAPESLAFMKDMLEREGRGFVFNRLLASYGEMRRCAVNECIKVYRNHVPKIRLTNSARDLLALLEQPLYMVTDGHKLVQQKKVQALDIESFFTKVFITHRYGVRNAKPSIHCFELIRSRHNCKWTDLVYIGDNPEKDFVSLNPLGVRTVRLLTGYYRKVKAKPGHDALYKIENLTKLAHCLPDLRLRTRLAANLTKQNSLTDKTNLKII